MAAQLSPLDYFVLIIFLLFSALVGIYHAFRGNRQRLPHEYLLANRNMHPVPVAISVVVSVLSAVTYLGTPAEVYVHGPQYWVVSINKVMVCYITVFAFCPLFYRLQVTSIYEYLDMRFGKGVRYFGVVINFVYLIVYMGIVVYGPALALNAVTGISLAGSIIAVGIVCTFYTTIGGISAVVWTDVFQSVIMLAGFLVTIIACCVKVGGFLTVFRINANHGRGTFFDFRPDPTIRHSFWSVYFGLGIMATSYIATNQIIVQRYMTCRNLRQSQLAAGMGSLLVGVVEIIAVFSGMCVYAYFAGCDPVTSGQIQEADQLMAFIMVELFHKVPGIAGLLISAAFSASLSTVSSGVNSLATMTGQDILKNLWPEMDDFKFTLILKCVSILYGLVCVGMAFLASILGGLIPITLSLISILNGPILGVFTLGAFFPKANSKGALVGMITAVSLGVWFKIGAMVYPPFLDDPPLYTDQCPMDVENVTTILTYDWIQSVSMSSANTTTSAVQLETVGQPGIAHLYSLSYAYYSILTSVTTIIVGFPISLIFKGNDSPVDLNLISPWVGSFCCCMPKPWKDVVAQIVGLNVRVAKDSDVYEPVDIQMDHNTNVNTNNI